MYNEEKKRESRWNAHSVTSCGDGWKCFSPPPPSAGPAVKLGYTVDWIGNDWASVKCQCSVFILLYTMASMVCRMTDTGRKWRAESSINPRCSNRGKSEMVTATARGRGNGKGDKNTITTRHKQTPHARP